MGWRYTLVDALWDTQIGSEKLGELVRYARRKGVSILVWYNSAGDRNTAPRARCAHQDAWGSRHGSWCDP